MKTNIKSIASKAFLILGFLSFSFFVSCSNDSNPEAVAEKFLNHINNGEFAEAKEYCDEPTAQLIGMMESVMGGKKDEMKNLNAKAEIISSEVNEDKATVKYKTTSTKEPNAVEQSLQLVKVDGKWKVSIDKENANKEGGMKAPAGDVEATDSLATPVDSLSAPVDSTEVAE